MDDLGGIKLIQASELNSEIVRGAVDYWQSKRTGDAPPLHRVRSIPWKCRACCRT